MNKIKKYLESLLMQLFKKRVLKKHLFTVGTYVHRKHASIVFEIDFNWYDEEILPVSVVKEVRSGKIFSIRHEEMINFVELKGNSPLDGTEI